MDSGTGLDRHSGLEPPPTRRVPRLDRCSPPELLAYFQDAWTLEDTLFNSLLDSKTFYLQPDALRNPLIFYLGHSAVFYINKLVRVGLITDRLNPAFEALFEVGVDPETADDLNDAIATVAWPEVAAVWHYRDRARGAIEQLIQTIDFGLPIHADHPLWALLMAIEHQRIHVETSSMLLRQLPLGQLQRPNGWQEAPSRGATPPNPLIAIPGGTVTLGKPASDRTYGWDSEYGQRVVEVEPFAIGQYPVTHGEYLEFVAAGGYDRADYWSAEAWAWKQANGVQHPKFWRSTPEGYVYRSTFAELALPLDWPVEVNYYEAIAFCAWRGPDCRLMTEAEWNRACQFAEGDRFPEQGNLNWRWVSPWPVGWSQTSDRAHLPADLRGNVWEWMGESFYPLPGFQPHPLYLDQSAPFFDDCHQLMLGGSWATNGAMALPSYRNWFRPYFYQHAGFRIAQSLPHHQP
ncbi:MAG: 5-histidylcysteine sulfoxide synthase [Oscillatoriales cyanobacterium]|nr:MAG: 5-histidylcysteine sulfoxide synthase [Oscillatoriales cyanobacterium]